MYYIFFGYILHIFTTDFEVRHRRGVDVVRRGAAEQLQPARLGAGGNWRKWRILFFGHGSKLAIHL